MRTSVTVRVVDSSREQGEMNVNIGAREREGRSEGWVSGSRIEESKPFVFGWGGGVESAHLQRIRHGQRLEEIIKPPSY
eukprot:3225690-Pleurochrysis_carterae.AAC.1